MSSIIVPLVNCKSGDLTDINNYRAITLSNAITKILEAVLLEHVNDKISGVDSQFGFKAGHSTSLCTFSFKQVVDYYTGRGSHVFVCFADFRKAFDRVNYWKLFIQAINRYWSINTDCIVASILVQSPACLCTLAEYFIILVYCWQRNKTGRDIVTMFV